MQQPVRWKSIGCCVLFVGEIKIQMGRSIQIKKTRKWMERPTPMQW